MPHFLGEERELKEKVEDEGRRKNGGGSVGQTKKELRRASRLRPMELEERRCRKEQIRNPKASGLGNVAQLSVCLVCMRPWV